MEQYFRMNQIDIAKCLENAMNFLEGAAIQWYIWIIDYSNFQNWTDFRIQIGQKFYAQHHLTVIIL